MPYLSILIPVYNWDVKRLLNRLHLQCLQLAGEVGIEIIVRDDGSGEKFTNAAVSAQLSLVNYMESGENLGRAVTRNTLLAQARGEYILFLDADMLPDRDDFIQRYLRQARNGAGIICGGISYLQNIHESPEYSFYLYKSRKTEALPAELRNTAPWRYLFTSNIMVRRDIMESIAFDSNFTGYGFEDIEWGIRLGTLHKILHIDNTCSHMGLMNTNQVFMKMRDSIPNYALLLCLHPEEAGRTGAAGLARVIKNLPDPFLGLGERLLSFLSRLIPWNPLVFYIFQGDKAILLARELKKTSREIV
jgi:glycosyltransferase involved in cell wall biosynthesis